MTYLDKEFIYKNKHIFILHDSYMYRNYTILEKCVVQVIRKYNNEKQYWFSMNIGNNVPCFKGTGDTVEESLDKLFFEMKEYYIKEKEQANKMIDLVDDILKQ